MVPDVPAIHRRFDYSVPAALDHGLRVGSRVRIELHGRRVGAWVVEDRVADTPGRAAQAPGRLERRWAAPRVVALAEWAAWRWAGPISSFLGTASPPRVVRGAWDAADS